MITAFQIVLLITMFLSFILALGGEKDTQDRSAKIFGLSLATMLVTLFFLQGGIR